MLLWPDTFSYLDKINAFRELLNLKSLAALEAILTHKKFRKSDYLLRQD
jgi:hypothetical protein